MAEHYKNGFRNIEKLSLKVSPERYHYPLVKLRNWVQGLAKGAARVVFNDKDRNVMDVIFHDPSKPLTRSGKNHEFSLAHYHTKHECDHSCRRHKCKPACPFYSSGP